ncbi:MAG: efflux RND transporter periplasmic adaptor subunit [Prolixibacteraceae bacterium]|jgi:membrane fusion protein (multidrug efflux system)
MKTSKSFMAFASVGALLLSGCTPRTNDRNTSETNQPVRVKVIEIGSGSRTSNPSYIGTIGESQSIPLSFLTSGTAEKVLVNEGQQVRKGQLLAVLNDENYRNAWQIASSKESQAQDAFNRLEPVYKKGSLPEVKYIEIKTALEQAKSMAAMSEKSLKDCKLYSPTNGMIGKKMIEPGMSIIPGNPSFQLVKIEKLKVSFPVPENEISSITRGQKASIRVSAIGDRLFEGEVNEIGVLSNLLSHTYTVKADLDNPGNLLKPGMVCAIQLSNPGLTDRIVIPLSAVQQSANGEKFVYTANGGTGKAEKKPVVAGPLTSSGIVITSGLTAGDLLITDGYQKISENSPIQILR